MAIRSHLHCPSCGCKIGLTFEALDEPASLERAEGIFSSFELSPDELLVADLLLKGMTLKAIARKLGKSSGSIKQRAYKLRKKMGLRSQSEFFFVAYGGDLAGR